MKKRISIFTLTLLFLVSTTGLPVSYHLCKMMQEKSLSECEVCKAEMDKIVMSCCAEETPEYAVTISSENPVCCQTEFVYNKIEDHFVTNKTNFNFISSTENLLQPVILISPSFDFYFNASIYTDSSPPFLIDPELHITNSVLLI